MQLKFSNTSILIFDINVVQSSNSRRSVAQPKLKPNWNIHFYKTTLKWSMKSVSNVNSFSREMICAVLNIYYGCKDVSDSVNRLQKTTPIVGIARIPFCGFCRAKTIKFKSTSTHMLCLLTLQTSLTIEGER